MRVEKLKRILVGGANAALVGGILLLGPTLGNRSGEYRGNLSQRSGEYKGNLSQRSGQTKGNLSQRSGELRGKADAGTGNLRGDGTGSARQKLSDRGAAGGVDRSKGFSDFRNNQGSGDRQANRQQSSGERQSARQQAAGDRQSQRGDQRANAQSERSDRLDDRQNNRNDAREDRQNSRDRAREDWQDFAEDVYDDYGYWGGHHGHYYGHGDDFWWGFGAGLVIGASIASLPTYHQTVVVTGTTYQYYGGVYYEPQPSGSFVVVAAPLGAEVEAPPPECTIIRSADTAYCYHYGSFFLWIPDKKVYRVVTPNVGTTVTFLPDGHETVIVSGIRYYRFGGITYQPYYQNNQLVYVVANI